MKIILLLSFLFTFSFSVTVAPKPMSSASCCSIYHPINPTYTPADAEYNTCLTGAYTVNSNGDINQCYISPAGVYSETFYTNNEFELLGLDGLPLGIDVYKLPTDFDSSFPININIDDNGVNYLLGKDYNLYMLLSSVKDSINEITTDINGITKVSFGPLDDLSLLTFDKYANVIDFKNYQFNDNIPTITNFNQDSNGNFNTDSVTVNNTSNFDVNYGLLALSALAVIGTSVLGGLTAVGSAVFGTATLLTSFSLVFLPLSFIDLKNNENVTVPIQIDMSSFPEPEKIKVLQNDDGSSSILEVDSSNKPVSIDEVVVNSENTVQTETNEDNSVSYDINSELSVISTTPLISSTPRNDGSYDIGTSSGNTYNYNPSIGSFVGISVSISNSGTSSGTDTNNGTGDSSDSQCQIWYDECNYDNNIDSCIDYNSFCILDDNEDNNESNNSYSTENRYNTSKTIIKDDINTSSLVDQVKNINNDLNISNDKLLNLKAYLSTISTDLNTTSSNTNYIKSYTNNNNDLYNDIKNNTYSANYYLENISDNIDSLSNTNDTNIINDINTSITDDLLSTYTQTYNNLQSDLNNVLQFIDSNSTSFVDLSLTLPNQETNCTYANSFLMGGKVYDIDFNICKFTSKLYPVFYTFVYISAFLGAIFLAFSFIKNLLKNNKDFDDKL